MERRQIPGFFGLLPLWVLSGCALLDGGAKHPQLVIDWHCVKDPQSGYEECHKRKLVNGQPVDDIIYATKSSGVKAASTARSPEEAVPWSKKPVTAVNSIEDSSALSVENVGPEPEKPKDTVDIWSK